MGEIRQAIASQVYEYMRQRPNEALFISAIAKGVNRNDGSVSTAMGRFARMPDSNIERVNGPDGPVRGLYIYRTNGKPNQPAVTVPTKTKPMYEFVGNTQSGDVIVRDEDDNLWRISPL
jgi:hypothetical protein